MANIKKLGKVVRVFKDNKVLVKTTIVPKINMNVLNEKLETIGRVRDVIGPVASPYALIETFPTIRRDKLLDSIVYINYSLKGRRRYEH